MAEDDRAYERRRAEVSWRNWYRTAGWRSIRKRRLEAEPLCRMCKAAGFINDGARRPDGSWIEDPREARLIVDHVEPHRGDRAKFFCYENSQSLCTEHHNSLKQRMEKSRFHPIGDDGWPVAEH